MTTNVPQITFGATGLVIPTAQAILVGVQADINAAFGGNLNPDPRTPQGQLASSETTIIQDFNNQFLALVNGIDPAYSSGRMQDGIGRIYFMSRIAAASSNTQATIMGADGTFLPIGSVAVDQSGNNWNSTAAATIPTPGQLTGAISGNILTVSAVASGAVSQYQMLTGAGVAANTIILTQTSPTTFTVSGAPQTVTPIAMVSSGVGVPFACTVTGAIACPAGQLNAIYRAQPGWDSITNASAAALGRNVESRADFESRRAASVAGNAVNTSAAVLAAVLSVPDVLDAYVMNNPLGVTSGAVVSGSISGTTLTVASVTSGVVAVGQTVVGAGVAPGKYITGGAGASWQVNISQTVGTESLTCAWGGVPLAPHSIYVGVSGGVAPAIGAAIFSKNAPGCNMNGNTTVSVQDKSVPYTSPYPTYSIVYNVLTPTPVLFSVQMLNNVNVPSNAITLVQNAIIATFTGANGSPRVRTGSTVLHSNFYAALFALGSWVQIVELQVGITAANQPSVLMQIDQEPTIAASGISVTFS